MGGIFDCDKIDVLQWEACLITDPYSMWAPFGMTSVTPLHNQLWAPWQRKELGKGGVVWLYLSGTKHFCVYKAWGCISCIKWKYFLKVDYSNEKILFVFKLTTIKGTWKLYIRNSIYYYELEHSKWIIKMNSITYYNVLPDPRDSFIEHIICML